MATKLKLTDTVCRNAAPGTKTWDTQVKGFALFCGQTKSTFYFQRDVHGKTHRVNLGNFGDVSVAQARVDAMELAAEHAKGLTAQRLVQRKMWTLEEALDKYLARPKLRSEHNKNSMRGQMQNHLSDWLPYPLDEITKEMCVARHEKVRKTASKHRPNWDGTRAANHVMKSFRAVYNHARRVHDLPECPTIAIEWYDEDAPMKIIDDLAKWDELVSALENPVHTAFYRFLLLTGLRLSEARSLRWDQVFDDHLHLPLTKNGREFKLPLLAEHYEIIEPMRAYESEYVFHGKRQAKHLQSPARIPWSAHTHRRTFATVATTDAMLLEETVGRLINHTPTSVTGSRYVVVTHEKLRDPMRDVVAAFKTKLPQLLNAST